MHKLKQEGLTFDDVLVLPKKSNVSLEDVCLKTNLTKDIKLNAPIMSSPMGTVTEARMAIAIARHGGIGVIHKDMPIEKQALEVDKVKRSEFGVIKNPISINPNQYISEANELMAKYRISGVPVTEYGKLVGIITNRDLSFEPDVNKKIYEVMTRENLLTASPGISLEEAKKILATRKVEKLPLVDDNGDLVGLITTKDISKTSKYPNSAKDPDGCLLAGAAVAANDPELLRRVAALVEVQVDIIVLEDLGGHTNSIVSSLKQVKSQFPDLAVIAGNVATKEATLELIEAGADAIRVGIGSGSVSNIGIFSGVGMPQITAVYNCSEAAKPHGIPIISDGGIRFAGDIVKAIAAGADVVMMGSMFAGCDESPCPLELYKGRKYKIYKAVRESSKLDRVEGRVAYKGAVSDILAELLVGIRSGMCYSGSPTVKDLVETGEFTKLSTASFNESMPYNSQITREATSYSTFFY